MKITIGIRLILAAALAALFLAAPASAKPGNADRAKAIYAKRCVLCHGVEGDGSGVEGDRLNPPPRDFSEGQYKFRTTHFDDALPNDEDIFRMIHDGMPGTAMPGWSDVLSEQDMWDLVVYLKKFGGLDEDKPEKQIDYGTQIVSSPESIAAGKKLFGDRCTECHGDDGKGDAVKRLKSDGGARTWPRNLTKPWTFRGSNDPRDIYTRITTGIAGTQMPSFDDPASENRLSIEQRWHVANYVNSLAKTDKVVRPENTVIRAVRVEGRVPTAPDDPQWQQALPTTFLLVPQLIAEKRFFTPTNDTITVRAVYNEEEIAFHLEWDDRTRSIPGDKAAEKIADPGISEDAVAIQLPLALPRGTEKPYFLRGNVSHPVNLWSWHSGTTDSAPRVSLRNARGLTDTIERDPAAVGLEGDGSYQDGTWQVVVGRPLVTADPTQDLQFIEGAFIPVAFSAWDGSNSEQGSAHTLTTWYWLLLKPPPGNQPWLYAGFAFVLILLLELWWARSARRRTRS